MRAARRGSFQTACTIRRRRRSWRTGADWTDLQPDVITPVLGNPDLLTAASDGTAELLSRIGQTFWDTGVSLPCPDGTASQRTGGVYDLCPVVAGAPTAPGAQLTGTINPNGLDTAYFVEYGTDESYGQSTTPVDAGSGDRPVVASATLAGLSPATIYHARLGLSNAQGRQRQPRCHIRHRERAADGPDHRRPQPQHGSEVISYTETADVSPTVCDLDSEPVACSSTQAVLSNLSVGAHNFEAQALGPNASSASATTAFTTAASPSTSTPTASDLSSVSALPSAHVNPDELHTTFSMGRAPAMGQARRYPASTQPTPRHPSKEHWLGSRPPPATTPGLSPPTPKQAATAPTSRSRPRRPQPRSSSPRR